MTSCGRSSGQRLSMVGRPRGEVLAGSTPFVEAGEVRPVIDRVIALEEIAEGHRARGAQSGEDRGGAGVSADSDANRG